MAESGVRDPQHHDGIDCLKWLWDKNEQARLIFPSATKLAGELSARTVAMRSQSFKLFPSSLATLCRILRLPSEMSTLLSRSSSIHLGTAERNRPAHEKEFPSSSEAFALSGAYPQLGGSYLGIRTSRGPLASFVSYRHSHPANSSSSGTLASLAK